MKPFLTAHWSYLAMLNYEIEPRVLAPLLPAKTELDSFNGKTFASMVGFLFKKTRVLGIPIPFHQNFEEINLRFYVRYKSEGEWRRGVVFVKEIVPRIAIAFLARYLYDENYIAIQTTHNIKFSRENYAAPTYVEYAWKFNGTRNHLSVTPTGDPQILKSNSEEEFITEHYWGYTRHRSNNSSEYRVDHPRWRVWPVSSSVLQCDVADLYGSQFVEFLSGNPCSAFLAEGSEVAVFQGKKLNT